MRKIYLLPYEMRPGGGYYRYEVGFRDGVSSCAVRPAIGGRWETSHGKPHSIHSNLEAALEAEDTEMKAVRPEYVFLSDKEALLV